MLRIGIGHDTHRLGGEGPLRLAGIDVPHEKSALGHSDADVLLHALTDALLGALALGDIGTWFPDTDPVNRGRQSADFLAAALAAVRERGWEIENVDCIVFAQRPKLAPHREALTASLSHLLGLPPDRIGFKAKTGEKVDAVGREEAIQAQAIVLLTRPGPHPV